MYVYICVYAYKSIRIKKIFLQASHMGSSAGLSGDPIAVSIMVNPLNSRKAMLMVRIYIYVYMYIIMYAHVYFHMCIYVYIHEQSKCHAHCKDMYMYL
jgi:hypothetical protein